MTTDNLLPLLGARDGQAPLAWRHGQPIGVGSFLADVQALAAALPPAGAVVNLCTDRYRFAVGLAAALVAGRPSLLPPDAREDTLARLLTLHPDLVALVEPDDAPPPVVRCVAVDADGVRASTPVAGMPAIAGHLHAASLLTSGSTGVPQAHGKTWQALHANVAGAAERLAALIGRPSLQGLTLVSTVPSQHSYGFESAILLALLGGASFDAGRPFYPADIAEALDSVPRPRALVTTPFHLKTLLSAGIALPPVDLVLSATAPLSPQLAVQAEQVFGGPLIEIYGCTEAGQVATRHTTQTEWWHTMGAMRITAHPPAAPGEPARFTVQGGPVVEAEALADVLVLQDDSRFRLLGRSNDLVHVAGRRSSLGHLNFQLNSIPGVEDGAFWLPDTVEDGVVRPVAFVVAPTLDAAGVIAALRERLEAVFVPRRIVFVDALPRVGTGKLTAGALRTLAHSLLGIAPAVAGAGSPPSPAGPVRVQRAIAADHPVFAGHFPGQPLLPGALLLSDVLEAVQAAPAIAARLGQHPALASAKFTAPVRPGAALEIVLTPTASADGGVDFEVSADGIVAARGRWTRGKEPAA